MLVETVAATECSACIGCYGANGPELVRDVCLAVAKVGLQLMPKAWQQWEFINTPRVACSKADTLELAARHEPMPNQGQDIRNQVTTLGINTCYRASAIGLWLMAYCHC